MVELTRRLFLIGSASAIAAVTLPAPPVLELPPEIIPVPAVQPYIYRQLFDIMASFYAEPVFDEDGETLRLPNSYGMVSLRRRLPGPLPPRPDDRLMEFGLGDGGSYRWMTHDPLQAFAFPADQVAELEFKSNISSGFIGEISLICHDKVDDGPPVGVVEYHKFSKGVHSVYTNFLDADNSLEARLQREEDKKNAEKERQRLIAAGIDPYADDVEYADDRIEDEDTVVRAPWWERFWFS